MYGYQFYNMQLAAEKHGWTKFSTMENHYNLLYREDERQTKWPWENMTEWNNMI
ncbi:hypothetical protein [Eubacterium sp.]